MRIAERVYQELIKSGRDCALIPLTSATHYLEKRNLKFLKLNELLEEYLENLQIKVSDRLKKFIKKESFKNHNPEIVSNDHTDAYYFLGLLELVTKCGFKKGVEKYKELERRSFEPINFSNWVIKKYKCKLVITTNVDRYEYAFRAAAFKNNIPVLSFDDLFGEFADKEKILSTIICVDNKIAKKNLQSLGYEGRIIVTGNPVFENLMSTNNSIKNKEYAIVVLTTGISGIKLFENFRTFDDNFLHNFFESIETYLLKNYKKVKVRFHPNMVQKKYWKNDVFEVDNEVDLHKSLENFGTVVGINCTTALYEAYLLGKHLINFNFTKTQNFRNLPIPSLGYVNELGYIEKFDSESIVNFNSQKNKKNRFSNELFKILNELLPNN